MKARGGDKKEPQLSVKTGKSEVANILALGGDPPKDLDLPAGELEHAVDLVRLVRDVGDFAIGVAAFPEPHPKSPSLAADRARTAEKLAEADFAITQFFFDAEHYFDLVSTLRDLGVDKPVIPGIMPATAISSIKRMTELQGSDFPSWLSDKMHAVADDPEAVQRRRRGGDGVVTPVARRWGAGSALHHAEPVARDADDLREPRPHAGELTTTEPTAAADGSDRASSQRSN